MTAIEKATKSLNLDEKWLNEFEVEDVFNTGMRLHGFISRKPNHLYGAMAITEINNQSTLQIIYGTPKINYPFDKNGVFNWPSISHLEGYIKEDGTNVVAYWYKFKGRRYLSFKTRLTPVLRDSTFGSFFHMWKEYYEDNLWVKETILGNPNYNISFEMFGSRNPITISYDISLDVKLLFGIDRKTAAILPPSGLNLLHANIPDRIVFKAKDFTSQYRKTQAELSARNQEKLTVEGMVWYAQTEDYNWGMFKLKPSEIENIHWTASDTIPKNSIWTTILNAYENSDEPVIEDVLVLLEEEYDSHLITKNMLRIRKLWLDGINHMLFVRLANHAWAKAKEQGFDITKDKNATLRFVSQFFNKKDMRKVGSVIIKQAGLLNKEK